MSNILIAYFSRAGENYFGGEIRPVSIGNTKICAELLKESLDADAFEAFKEHGIFDPATATAFRKNILEKGGSDDPMKLYHTFRGADPSLEPLLKNRGLK